MNTTSSEDMVTVVMNTVYYVKDEILNLYNNPPPTPVSWSVWFFGIVGFLGLATTFFPFFISFGFFQQNLKKRYNASWALVTGK